MAGIVQMAAAGGFRRAGAKNRGATRVRTRCCQQQMPLSETKRRPLRAWAIAAAAACLLAGLIALNAPGADSAPLRVLVLGQTAETPKPACPGKLVNGQPVVLCKVEGHVTGFQSVADGVAKPFEVPFDGKIVAWSISLSRPSTKETDTTTNEVNFFNEFLGAPAEARVGILRPVEGTNPPQYKLVRQSPIEVLNPYFGSTPVFALDHPLSVLKGQVVALTIPTWAPMFAIELSTENTWRGSRAAGHCVEPDDIQNGHPQQGVGKTKTYGCFFAEARLLYTATLVKQP